MAALVQTIPQQDGSATILQTRPSSASGSASHTSRPHLPRSHTMSPGPYSAGGGSPATRSSTPVAPYAFTSTPSLVSVPQSGRSNSLSAQDGPPRLPPIAAGTVSSSSSSSTTSNVSNRSHASQDDSVLSSRVRTNDIPRPLSTANVPSPFSWSQASPSSPSKPSPDRYRRPRRQSIVSQSGNSPAPSSNDTVQTTSSNPLPARPIAAVHGHVRTPSADTTRPQKQQHPELATRYRRRSWGSLDAAEAYGLQGEKISTASLLAPLPDLKLPGDRARPASSHSRNGSTESIHSSRSARSVSSIRERDQSPARSTSSRDDANKHSAAAHNPSPLSQQVTVNTDSSEEPSTAKGDSFKGSLAARRLADLSKAAPRKIPGKSRLRRVFSFGSAADLHKASAQNTIGERELVDDDDDQDGPHRTSPDDELDPEQAAIAAQQEANGLGESIYANHGHLFKRSTDNLSISSTASSASMMLRKMGRGMKKSTRSLVGLFRPKQHGNAQSEPMTVEPTTPQVSAANVEAERKTMTANPSPQETAGATLFPRVESESKQKAKSSPSSHSPGPESQASPGSSDNTSARTRKSIVGGEKERAEVLASVRKGILKRECGHSPASGSAGTNVIDRLWKCVSRDEASRESIRQ